MTDINSDVLERVRALPAKQQRRFHDILEDGEDRPKETADKLRKDLSAGKVDKDFLLTSQLAVAALNDSHTPDKFLTEQEARGSYMNEIRRLREIDPDDPTAARLEGILNKLTNREETDRTRAETVKADAEKAHLKADEDRLAAFEKAYAEHKASRIAELSRFSLMDAEQAEARFMEIESAHVSASLKRFHGIPAA
jgi:hypothetical protein